MPLDVPPLRTSRFGSPPGAQPRALVRPELVAEVKYLTWTDDNLLREVVYEGLREEAGGRRGSPAGAALTTLSASLNDQIGPTIVRRDSVFDNRPSGDRRTRSAHV